MVVMIIRVTTNIAVVVKAGAYVTAAELNDVMLIVIAVKSIWPAYQKVTASACMPPAVTPEGLPPHGMRTECSMSLMKVS